PVPPNVPLKPLLFCPIYHPPTGDDLKDLARRLSPVLARTGWQVLILEGEEGGACLEIRNKDGQSRRLSPDEALAWQALLPQLSGLDDLFSSQGPGDRKDK
ncbi:MAG: hypothetical protein ACM3YF_04410, partial [Candidatus Zixiibacteriota bacterium]